MADEKTPIPAKVRKEVLQRDQHACRKCGSRLKLEVHHIRPVPRINEPDNLITLCSYCHHEWEHLIYIRTEMITFEQWVAMPTYLAMVAIFADESRWPDTITAREARAGFFQAFELMRTFRKFEQVDDEDE